MTDSRRANRHFVVGIIILIVGLILLLDQLGFTEANKLWPLILIYFGVNKFSASRDPVGRFWGGFLALLGICLELEALGSGYIRLGTIWPVFLICVGVLLVLRHYDLRRWMESFPPPPPPPSPPGPETPAAPGSEPPAAHQDAAANAPGPGVAPGPSSAVGPEPSQAGSQQAQTPPPPPSSPPPPPPGQANYYNPEWWGSQRSWERFQRKMDRMNERMNRKWGPQSNWADPNAWQASPGSARGSTWYESTEPRLNDVNVFWGTRRRIVSKNFTGGEIVAIFGGFEIDLSEADIQGTEAKLDIVAIFGGGEVRVPQNWNVILETIGIFGGASDRSRHPVQVNAAAPAAAQGGPAVKTLIIDGVSLFGGVTIKN